MSKKYQPYDLSIIGTVGLPAAYGGFETLAEQLVKRLAIDYSIQVFCSGKKYPSLEDRPKKIYGADLVYLEWDANGWQSIIYDFISLWRSRNQSRNILVLGISGCLLVPIIRLLKHNIRVVTNIDGLEWKRRKWSLGIKFFLRISEWFAVKFSHAIVADNQAVLEYVKSRYKKDCHLIAYGGDNSPLDETGSVTAEFSTQHHIKFSQYYLAICRIEPENNIEQILEAFLCLPNKNLVFVGNWGVSEFSKLMRNRYRNVPNIQLLESIYDQLYLKSLRKNATGYIHGHSAGGTNPSLVEAMNCGIPVLVFNVEYNIYTTENQAIYWSDSEALVRVLNCITAEELNRVGANMLKIAQLRYTWAVISRQYRNLIFSNDVHYSP
jgi:glycosyltransferase involved in cell wall biosynthesis